MESEDGSVSMENKKSFVLYADLIHTVIKLPDIEAGLLFKHLLKYVNDESPVTDNILVEVAFEHIKQQLKRDLEKWKKTSSVRSEIGRIGGLASASSKSKQLVETLKQKQANASKRKQIQHDNVNVNVNDSVNDSVNVNDIHKSEIPSKNEFLDFCKTIENFNFNEIEFSLRAKYDAWAENKWQDGHDKKIKNWKTKIKNTIPFLKPTSNGKQNSNTAATKRDSLDELNRAALDVLQATSSNNMPRSDEQ